MVSEKAGQNSSENTEKEASEKQAPLSPEQEKISKLEADLAAANAKYSETYDRMMRIAADADNTRKRVEKEKIDARIYSIQEFAKDLLPVIDAFDKAAIAIDELKINADSEEGKKIIAVFEGVKLVTQTFQTAAKKNGIERLPGKGTPFNPSFHNAISKVTDASYTTDTVVEEFVTGYKIGERILRTALVKVGTHD